MIFVQILNGYIKNTLFLDTPSMLPLFKVDPSTGETFDYVLQVDGVIPQPGIGWFYDGNRYYPPVKDDPVDTSSPDYIIAQKIAWGQYVLSKIMAFFIGCSSAEELLLITNLSSIKTALELGLLQAAGSLMSTSLYFIMAYDLTQSVRERFSTMILTEGPTP